VEYTKIAFKGCPSPFLVMPGKRGKLSINRPHVIQKAGSTFQGVGKANKSPIILR
jgi:hypothetical protein